MTEGLDLEVRGQVATLWLDRIDKRNAMSAAMWAGIPEAVQDVEADRAVRVLVLRGRGTHFCAGADITALGASLAADTDAVAYRTLNAQAESALSFASVPTIAAIDGSCIGGGVQLALACDLRVATSRARLGITAGRLGISYPASSLARLADTVGAATARRLLVTSVVLDGGEALRVGLVHLVVDHEALNDAVDSLVADVVATSAVTQLAAKEMLTAWAQHQTVPASLAREWEQLASSGDDLREGLDAFAARRTPRFGPRPPRRAQ